MSHDDGFTLLSPTSEHDDIMTPPGSVYTLSEDTVSEDRYETSALSTSSGHEDEDYNSALSTNSGEGDNEEELADAITRRFTLDHDSPRLPFAFYTNINTDLNEEEQHVLSAFNNFTRSQELKQPRVCTCNKPKPTPPPKSSSLIEYDNVFLHLIHLKYTYQREIIPVKEICSLYDGLPNWDRFTSWLPPVPGFRNMWGNRDAFQLSFDPKKDVMILEKKFVITNQTQLRSALQCLVSLDKDLGVVNGVVCGRQGLMVNSEHGWDHHFECN